MQMGYLHSQTSWKLNKFNQDTESNTEDGISTFAAVTINYMLLSSIQCHFMWLSCTLWTYKFRLSPKKLYTKIYLVCQSIVSIIFVMNVWIFFHLNCSTLSTGVLNLPTKNIDVWNYFSPWRFDVVFKRFVSVNEVHGFGVHEHIVTYAIKPVLVRSW